MPMAWGRGDQRRWPTTHTHTHSRTTNTKGWPTNGGRSRYLLGLLLIYRVRQTVTMTMTVLVAQTISPFFLQTTSATSRAPFCLVWLQSTQNSRLLLELPLHSSILEQLKPRAAPNRRGPFAREAASRTHKKGLGNTATEL